MTESDFVSVSPTTLAAPHVNAGAGFVSSTLAVALRTIRKFFRTPQLVVFGTVQSAIFLLIFFYVFGGAISIEGLAYVDFLVPGFVTTGVLWSGMAAAAGIAEDVEQGFFDRLRSLPIPRASVLAGRSLADTALVTWGLAVATAIGFLIGFRLHGSLVEGLAAFGLCVLFGFAFEWAFLATGLVAGNSQAAQGMALLFTPLSFVSSAFVPVDTMPDWLQVIAANQPITVMVDTMRALTGGPQAQALLERSTMSYVALSLAWCAAIILIFGLIAVTRFSRR